MSGKILVVFMLAGAAIFGASMWYFQVHAYYDRIEGLETVSVQGIDVPVSGYFGIDADTSPNKLRGCFNVDPAAFADAPPARDPDPLIAPGWFDCFDAERISADLEAGRATAYLAADETPAGASGYEILRMIAVYPDGQAFMWRHYRDDK